jgi:ABC-type antimicrobial peptide transport system permease subunit
VFYITYIAAELRRRSGRTLLTALGLAVGVGLVVTVSALSNGLDDAQSKVLKPLTGVGTDMSVNRPLQRSGSSGNFGGGGSGGPPRLSSKEQEQLRKENGNRRFGFESLGKPGEHFSRDNFVTTQLSFPASEVEKISGLSGVKQVASGLTLSAIHVEGTVPEQQVGGQFGGPPGAGGGGAPQNIDLDNRTVSGIDVSKPGIALVTPSQVTKGRYFSSGSAAKTEAVLSTSYARRKGIAVGDKVTLASKKFTVVGISRPPLGGQASDAYLELGTLQKLADHKGRVNVLQVRATSADQVGSLSKKIESSFAGAQVTTSKELADRVGGSLADTKNLSGKLGTALAIVALAAAFLIASFLTLSSVTKRVRELGTLKALGWKQSLVVRQVSGESLVQGVLGGLLGAAVGLAGAGLIDAIGPTLEATVARASGGGGPGAGGPFAFGQGQVTSGSTHVTLSAPVDVGLILLAIGLAIVGGLLAGAIGGLRAARLRPAEALRHID